MVETPDEAVVEAPVPDEATGEAIEEPAEEAVEDAAAEAPVMPPVDELVRELAAATAVMAPEPVLETAGDGPPADHGFIPPPPVMPGPKATLSGDAEPFAAAAMSNGGKAAAPKGARRGPSLFERMTGTGRARQTKPAHESGPAPKLQPELEPASQPAPRVEPVLETAAAAEPAFAPSKPPKPAEDAALPKVEEDVLDIPAFLRRRSN